MVKLHASDHMFLKTTHVEDTLEFGHLPHASSKDTHPIDVITSPERVDGDLFRNSDQQDAIVDR